MNPTDNTEDSLGNKSVGSHKEVKLMGKNEKSCHYCDRKGENRIENPVGFDLFVCDEHVARAEEEIFKATKLDLSGESAAYSE